MYLERADIEKSFSQEEKDKIVDPSNAVKISNTKVVGYKKNILEVLSHFFSFTILINKITMFVPWCFRNWTWCGAGNGRASSDDERAVTPGTIPYSIKSDIWSSNSDFFFFHFVFLIYFLFNKIQPSLTIKSIRKENRTIFPQEK